jgi:hypothetical protein
VTTAFVHGWPAGARTPCTRDRRTADMFVEAVYRTIQEKK